MTLEQARAQTKAELAALLARVRRIERANPAYAVELSPALTRDRDALRHQHNRAEVQR